MMFSNTVMKHYLTIPRTRSGNAQRVNSASAPVVKTISITTITQISMTELNIAVSFGSGGLFSSWELEMITEDHQIIHSYTGNTLQTVSKTLTGLVSNTLYYFRARVKYTTGGVDYYSDYNYKSQSTPYPEVAQVYFDSGNYGAIDEVYSCEIQIGTGLISYWECRVSNTSDFLEGHIDLLTKLSPIQLGIGDGPLYYALPILDSYLYLQVRGVYTLNGIEYKPDWFDGDTNQLESYD